MTGASSATSLAIAAGERLHQSRRSVVTCSSSARRPSKTMRMGSSGCCSCCGRRSFRTRRASRIASRARRRCHPARARRGGRISAACRRASVFPLTMILSNGCSPTHRDGEVQKRSRSCSWRNGRRSRCCARHSAIARSWRPPPFMRSCRRRSGIRRWRAFASPRDRA